MVTELFSHLERAPRYDGNPEADLIAMIGGEKYRPKEMPELIGLYSGKYIMAFEPGELKGVLFSVMYPLEY